MMYEYREYILLIVSAVEIDFFPPIETRPLLPRAEWTAPDGTVGWMAAWTVLRALRGWGVVSDGSILSYCGNLNVNII